MADEIVRYLAGARDCWWSARRIGAALPQARDQIQDQIQKQIQDVLELFWRQGRLRRKRGPGGEYEYQMRFAERR